MPKRSRRYDAPTRNVARQPRSTKQFSPSIRQITTAVELITEKLKHYTLIAHDHAAAARKLHKEFGHQAYQLGNTDGQRRITILLVLKKLVGEKVVQLLDEEYVLAA